MIVPTDKNAVAKLCDLLRETGLRATFDPRRNLTHPCYFCEKSEKKRELVTIGYYLNGDDLTRPVCPTAWDRRGDEAAARRHEGPGDARR